MRIESTVILIVSAAVGAALYNRFLEHRI